MGVGALSSDDGRRIGNHQCGLLATYRLCAGAVDDVAVGGQADRGAARRREALGQVEAVQGQQGGAGVVGRVADPLAGDRLLPDRPRGVGDLDLRQPGLQRGARRTTCWLIRVALGLGALVPRSGGR